MDNRHFVSRDACPACASPRVREVYRAPYCEPPLRDYLKAFYDPQGGVEFEHLQGADYVLAECAACELVFQAAIPDDFLMERLYDHWIDADKQYALYERDHDTSYYHWLAGQMLVVGALCPGNPGSRRLLDFGMGWGDWCRMALAFGYDAYGAELSRWRIEHAARFGVPVLEWEQIPGARLDFINTEQVFEHVPRPLEMLMHLARGLRPGGIIRLSVPDGTDVARRFRKMDWAAPKSSPDSLNPVAPLEHVNCYRPGTLVRMAEAAGLQKLRLPRSIEYASQTGWTPLRPILKNLLRPLLRPRLNVGTSVFFVKPG